MAKSLAELTPQQQINALKEATVIWNAADHPELKAGTVAWVRKIRREWDRRLQPS
jgi:hypothetical protein